ncbi:hypothetical protein STENM327S_07804 [Streptomyces tendae]
MADYFRTKQAIMTAVRGAGFARWTVIKPAFFMENLPLLAPKGPRGGLLTVLKPETELALVAVRDIGTAAAHAFETLTGSTRWNWNWPVTCARWSRSRRPCPPPGACP